MRVEHPAVSVVLQESKDSEMDDLVDDFAQTTSLSLARALAIGCLSGLDANQKMVDIWDPAVGVGFAGHLLMDALESAGVQVRYRGQDVSRSAVDISRRRFDSTSNAEFSVGDTLMHDRFSGFAADLVIVDPPWGCDWKNAVSEVETRQTSGEFRFGLPSRIDSTWLFISLALEKLRPIDEGGGRVAALVHPSALSSHSSRDIRRNIVEAGLLESVTRLPDRLAANTSIPLYLVTFTNQFSRASHGKVKIADLQTEFITDRRARSIPEGAFRELERGLRTGKQGPRNRIIDVRKFTRRTTRLSRTTSENRKLAWSLTTYQDTPIDTSLLESRYGPDSGVLIGDESRKIFDLNPSNIFGDGLRELHKELNAKGWPHRRLSTLLKSQPEAVSDEIKESHGEYIFIPTSATGRVSRQFEALENSGHIVSIVVESSDIQPDFLVAWLNSDLGKASRRQAINDATSRNVVKALRSDANSLMRWADALIVPVPDSYTQFTLAQADDQLGSFLVALHVQRANIWETPESADEVVNKIAPAFDDSLSGWYDQLPYPIATALWRAETCTSLMDQRSAYIHAWEAIVTFHASVLLAASRNNPSESAEMEAAIRRTLHEQHLGIARASFGTWVIIVERTAKELRKLLETNDIDDAARIRRAFAGLEQTGIERLISKGIVNKFNEVNGKRNSWLGHGGFTPQEVLKRQVDSLIGDLRELRQLLGNVWSQLLLVRAGSIDPLPEGLIQSAEIAIGIRSPFMTQEFTVGAPMHKGELYLVREGAQSPLRLGPFVQLRQAPSDAQYTSYFYNRTEDQSVRLVTYQYATESEIHDDVESFGDFEGLSSQ